MNEKELREVISNLSDKEIVEALTIGSILPDVKKFYKDEAAKRFVENFKAK